MRRLSRDGWIGRILALWEYVREKKVSVYSANACYFIVLAFLPALLLLVELLRTIQLDAERLSSLLAGVLPEAFGEPARQLIVHTYGRSGSALLGISAITTLWSASRGMYGILTGLNAIYGVPENRSYVFTRLISTVYTLIFFAVLILTLLLQVFMGSILQVLIGLSPPFLHFLLQIVDFRFFLLLFLQVFVFTLMFMVFPNQRNSLRDSLPGALLASCGWLIFSDLFSFYVEHVASIFRFYGPLSALALGMLWLYWCICIVFYGGVLNVALRKWR